QHDIAAAFLELRDAALDQLPVGAQIVAAQDGVRADLPDHQFRVLGDYIAVEPGQFLRDVFTAFSAIDHPDVDTGDAPLERGLEPARVAQLRGARADPQGRGRAHGNDRQR